ncbi:AI-2E family transporter [Companilactobacillus sp.]|uniref:AI-2E family transporter n=1 Tax=Companilactobacillus sp. TaxID=2767905 RepID=UPI0025C21B16|nr:AI-2E family transporter [Companilactobacillus sp.]MCH4010060.1 AI-2E family transporter [Companilactobacillus sp.]MCH4052264.1 AI-2E family transporter [Companilactobacillus sp.]MCH4078002.1 AI-2E family transporter [Companilactobacillus sp.]MCH4126578.1 AI-2E family transporter [Companilactobacillus sp.]MCH4132163.1 AI-2E family transporter [Companilactobacillus sp.]
MELNRKNITKYGLLVVLILVLLIYPTWVYQVFLNLLGVMMPLILGAILAYVLNLICVKLEKHFFPNTKWHWLQKSRRGIVILIALLIVILVISGVFRLVLPQFISALTSFFKSIPAFFNDVANFAQKINSHSIIPEQVKSIDVNWNSVQSKVMKFLTSGLGGVFGSTIKIVTGVAKGLFNFILALTFAVYILATKEKLGSQIDRASRAFIKEKHLQKIKYVLHVTNQMFSSFIVGQVTEAIILGTLCTLGMFIFRFPYALSVGAFVGITSLVPILGAWMGGAVGFLLIAVDSPLNAVLFIVFIIVLQQLESNLVYPRVVGTSIGLPGIWVLAAITIGGGLSGIVGMLLGVPVVATIYQLMKNKVNQRLDSQVTDVELEN